MKSLTRTIIVLVAFCLVMGSFALAQAEGAAEPTARGRSPMPTPPKPTQPGTAPPTLTPVEPTPPTLPAPVPEAPVPPAPPAPSPYPTQARSTGHISNRKVLVIPATDVEVEDIVEITQDLQVMSHIFDERFKQPRRIEGVFVDFGDFFGRDSRGTEVIYLQGYGALFLMEVNFAFTPPPKLQEQEAKKTEEYVDPTWQRARQKVFSPKGFGGSDFVPEEKYSAEKIEQLKTELIKTLKHATNIRNLKADEWVILTVIGQGRQSGEFHEDYYRSAALRSRTSTSRRSRRPSSSRGGGAEGDMMARMGMGGGMGGIRMGGMAGGMYGGGGFGGMGMGGGMMGGMVGYGEMSVPSTTVLTIRAKKSDVDDFAKGELDFEQFQQKVQIFTY